MSGRADGYDRTPQRDSPSAANGAFGKNLSLRGSVGDEAAQAALHDVSFSLAKAKFLESTGCSARDAPNWWKRSPDCRPMASAKSQMRGQRVRIGSVRERIEGRDRADAGRPAARWTVSGLSIRENVVMSAQARLIFSRAEETTRVRKLAAELHIAAKISSCQ